MLSLLDASMSLQSQQTKNLGPCVHLVHFMLFSKRKATFKTSFCFPKVPSEKGSTLKGKNLLYSKRNEFATKGSKLFPFRV